MTEDQQSRSDHHEVTDNMEIVEGMHAEREDEDGVVSSNHDRATTAHSTTDASLMDGSIGGRMTHSPPRAAAAAIDTESFGSPAQVSAAATNRHHSQHHHHQTRDTNNSSNNNNNNSAGEGGEEEGDHRSNSSHIGSHEDEDSYSSDGRGGSGSGSGGDGGGTRRVRRRGARAGLNGRDRQRERSRDEPRHHSGASSSSLSPRWDRGVGAGGDPNGGRHGGGGGDALRLEISPRRRGGSGGAGGDGGAGSPRAGEELEPSKVLHVRNVGYPVTQASVFLSNHFLDSV